MYRVHTHVGFRYISQYIMYVGSFSRQAPPHGGYLLTFWKSQICKCVEKDGSQITEGFVAARNQSPRNLVGFALRSVQM